MSPVPVMLLRSVVLLVVFTISFMSCFQIMPVRPIFVIIPVMVITVVPIVDPNLDAALLRSRVGHDCRWRSNGRGQEQ